jgi:hypothetical protein
MLNQLPIKHLMQLDAFSFLLQRWPHAMSAIPRVQSTEAAFSTLTRFSMNGTAGVRQTLSTLTGVRPAIGMELLARRKKTVVFVNKAKEFKNIGAVAQLEGELLPLMSDSALVKAEEKLGLSSECKP